MEERNWKQRFLVLAFINPSFENEEKLNAACLCSGSWVCVFIAVIFLAKEMGCVNMRQYYTLKTYLSAENRINCFKKRVCLNVKVSLNTKEEQTWEGGVGRRRSSFSQNRNLSKLIMSIKQHK